MDFLEYAIYPALKDFPQEITLDNVLAVITYLGNAPISTLVSHFEGSLGDTFLGVENRPFLVVYPSICMDLAMIVRRLIDTEEVVLKLCDPLLYYLSDTWPSVPIALGVDEEITEYRWLPACLCPSLNNKQIWKTIQELQEGLVEEILRLNVGEVGLVENGT